MAGRGPRRGYSWGIPRAALGVVLVFLATAVHARHSELVISGDSRNAFLVEPFCFAPGGKLHLEVSDFQVKVGGLPVHAQGRVGFVVRHVDGAEHSTANVVDVAGGQQCMMKPSGSEKPEDKTVLMDKSNVSFSMDVGEDKTGLYSVLYSNCVQGSEASFKLSVTLLNAGNVFLSAGDIPLPACYGGMAVGFFLILGLWVNVIRSNADGVHKIHYLMALLCFVKAVTVTLEAVRFFEISKTGDGSFWTTAYYFFAFLKGMMMFSVILLIGTGWSFIKPFLGDRDKKILLAVLPLQVVVNTAMIVVEETPPGTMGWLTWRDILHLVDVICCCAVLFPIVWSIRYLRESAEADGKSQRNLDKLKLFREFYIIVVCYIYFTRIIVYLVRATLPCRYSWVSKSTSELATLLFFLLAGYKFRPVHNNPYLKVDDEDNAEGTEMRETAEVP